MKPGTTPILLEGVVQNYSWGRIGADSMVARLVDRTDDLKPYAELWFGTHPRGAARVVTEHGDSTLDQLIASSPDSILGADVAGRFMGQLPFLFKVLSVNQALSIQAHPDKRRAEILHRESPGEYPDRNHKPEIAIPLSEMELLYGFRPVAEIQVELKLTPELKDLVESAAEARDLVRQVHAAIVHAPPGKREHQCRVLEKRLKAAVTLRPIDQLILTLIPIYGYQDIGIFTALLMNFCTVRPGEAIFVGADIPHAYLSGDLVECMANSDNVVRAGLTPKYQDAETLLAMLSYERGDLKTIAADEIGTSPIVRRYHTPAEEFGVDELTGEGTLEQQTENAPVMLISLGGTTQVEAGGLNVQLETGKAALIPASAARYRLSLVASSRLFRVRVP